MNWTSLPIQHLLTKVACIAVYTADLLRMSSRSARSSLPKERRERESPSDELVSEQRTVNSEYHRL